MYENNGLVRKLDNYVWREAAAQIRRWKDEFGRANLPFDLDTVLLQENPVWYLVETEKLSDHALETLIDIIFHSEMEEDRKTALLNDALAYLDGKGYFSIRLHSLISN